MSRDEREGPVDPSDRTRRASWPAESGRQTTLSAGGAPRRSAHERSCLVALGHPERGLARALLAHLRDEIPGVRFFLERGLPDGAKVDAVWICGPGPGSVNRITALRAAHPRANLIVTRRDPDPAWTERALGAGADHALVWPEGVDEIARILRN